MGAGVDRPTHPVAGPGEAEQPVVVHRLRPGAGADPPRLLLLHGLAGSMTGWDAYAARAAPGFEVWAAELPWRGEGVGDWAHRPDVGHWAASAIVSVPARVDAVVAHSFAANVLLEHLAGPTPDGPDGPEGPDDLLRPRALVLVSPFYRKLPDDFGWDSISYYLNDFDRILAEGIRVRSRGRVDPEICQGMAERVRDRVGPYGWTRFFDTYLRTPMLRLGRLTQPCVVIGGENDFASFPDDSRQLAGSLPHAAAHLFPDCGHFAMVEQPELFADLVNDFLCSVLDGPSAAPAAAPYPELELNR